MKKKLFFAGAALLLAAAAVTGYSLRGESNLSALLDANVEALAGNEEVGGAYSQRAVCGNCGADITICVYCVEVNCGSCNSSVHFCH